MRFTLVFLLIIVALAAVSLSFLNCFQFQFISFSIDPLQGLNHMDIEIVRST